MDVTPLIPGGMQVIESYGRRGFHVSGVAFTGAILVFPETVLEWPVPSFADLTAESFRPVLDKGGVEILLLGCGARMQLVPSALRQALRASGIVMDPMDTGAACRTYNVLLSEDRRVAAALLPAI